MRRVSNLGSRLNEVYHSPHSHEDNAIIIAPLLVIGGFAFHSGILKRELIIPNDRFELANEELRKEYAHSRSVAGWWKQPESLSYDTMYQTTACALKH
jgi:hypothetical protein